jgi:hypothetical protein
MKRLAGSRGLEHLGNGSTVEQASAKLAECQADRLVLSNGNLVIQLTQTNSFREAKSKGEEPDEFFSTKEDSKQQSPFFIFLSCYFQWSRARLILTRGSWS